MGREMWLEVRDPDGHVFWNSADEDIYFCGRNDDTNAVCRYMHQDDEFDVTSDDDFNMIFSALRERDEANSKLYDEMERECNDLLLARTHAATLDAFQEFTGQYKYERQVIEETYWNRAADMMDAMQQAVKNARKAVGGSPWDDEVDYVAQGVRIIWVDSE